MVAPVASSIMADILPALGVEPDYSAQELQSADAAVPNVVGQSAADAKARLEAAGFSCRTVGGGDTVTDQTPAGGGAIVPGDAEIVLYLGAEKPTGPLHGAQCGGAHRLGGQPAPHRRGADSEDQRHHLLHLWQTWWALSQDRPAGTEVPAGTVVTVQFGDNSVLD